MSDDEFTHGQCLRCPYCKRLDPDAWECFNTGHKDGDRVEAECQCGRTYEAEISISVTYTSRELPYLERDEESE